MQFQRKLTNQTWKNGKKLVPDLILGPLAQIFFSWILLQLDLRHCCKLSLYSISRKRNEPTWGNGQKPSFGPEFVPFWPKFGPKTFFVVVTSARYYTLLQAIIIVWARFWPIWPKFWPPIWRCQSLNIVSYHHVQYQKKLIIQSWKNLITDRRPDSETDRLTESDSLRRCPTNVGHPKKKKKKNR